MSGICGWSIYQPKHQSNASIIDKMASKLSVNRGHPAITDHQHYSSLASVGTPENTSIYKQDGVFIAIEGKLRWQDQELAQLSSEFSVAHALAAAYRIHGVNLFGKLSGAFAFAILDENNHRTLIAIDRIGISSLFYSFSQEQLIFSSNARSIQAHPDVKSEINPQAIFDYLYFHMVPSPRCIFSGVEKLLPGQYLLVENNSLSKEFYWNPDFSETSNSSQSLLGVELIKNIEDSISRAAENTSIGAFLSGGIDSSTVAGMLRKTKGQPVDTYSIGFDAPGFDEMEYARIAAKHFDIRLHEYYLTPQDVVDAIPLIAQAYDEPFGNASAVPAYYCAKLAKADNINTLLAGDGGDELFAGNERYAKQKVFELYFKLPQAIRQHILEPAIFNFPFGDALKPIAKSRSYIQQANVLLPDRLETYNLLNRIPLENIFEQSFLGQVDANEPITLLRESYDRRKDASSLNRMLLTDWKFTLADSDLRKVNRMTELAQIEVRYPLLDEALVEFSTHIPSSLKLRGFKLRYFFKQTLNGFLPTEILTKSKHGFGLPFGLWMNTYSPLYEIAHDSLSKLSQRGIVNPAFISQLQKLHQEFPNYYGVMIWVLMMLEQWLQVNNKAEN